MNLLKNYSLKKLNTFRVDVNAAYYCEIASLDDLVELTSNQETHGLEVFILGYGANILFTSDYEGVVAKMNIRGVKIVSENDDSVVLEIGAGENWHELVMHAVKEGWGGIENLVYIPGTVGAAVVQNIAAYGQNFSDIFENATVFDLAEKKSLVFAKAQCEFEYRNSFFKKQLDRRFVITSVQIKLSKHPDINTSYFETGKTFAKNVSLVTELTKIGTPPYTVRDVAQAVMNIRKQKLPEISKVGTAGSFFKNPIVSQQKYKQLKAKDPNLQCYPVERLDYVNIENLENEKFVKIPAGRLLDNIGWKGKRIGNVGTFETQALAVVNYGATPEEILDFTKTIQDVFYQEYKIKLEQEVVII